MREYFLLKTYTKMSGRQPNRNIYESIVCYVTKDKERNKITKRNESANKMQSKLCKKCVCKKNNEDVRDKRKYTHYKNESPAQLMGRSFCAGSVSYTICTY